MPAQQTLNVQLQQVITNLTNALKEASAQDGGNKSAGVRLRKALQTAKGEIQAVKVNSGELSKKK